MSASPVWRALTRGHRPLRSCRRIPPPSPPLGQSVPSGFALPRPTMASSSRCPMFTLTPSDGGTGAGNRWRLPAFLLFCPCHAERAGVAHVVPDGLDPAVGAVDVGDAELVDIAVEEIGDAAVATATLRFQ
jgi:hypothetical protein